MVAGAYDAVSQNKNVEKWINTTLDTHPAVLCCNI